MQINIIRPSHSYLSLNKESELVREARKAILRRKQNFWDEFDAHSLVYDIFWHVNNSQILLICPPPLNLEPFWREAKFIAHPTNKKLSANFYILRSTMTIALNNAPQNTTEIEIIFNKNSYRAKVQDNLSDKFANSRLLFTMSKNNPLEWIKEWATYHQLMHNVDAIIFFDNGSTIYKIEDIEKTLASVKGIKNIAIISFPHKYGPHDGGVIMYRFWANFLQISSFSILFRRFANKAYGILNCDIDELVAPIKDSDIFEVAKNSPDGLCMLNGRWVESTLTHQIGQKIPLHTDFHFVRRDFRAKLNANKWALDMNRDWLNDLSIHLGVHRLRNVPKKIANNAPRWRFWHFKGINTNWKESRNFNGKRSKLTLYEPDELKIMFKKYAEKAKINLPYVSNRQS